MDSDRSVSSALPPGLSVLEDFVSPEEELQLLQAVDWMPHTDDVTGKRYLTASKSANKKKSITLFNPLCHIFIYSRLILTYKLI